MKAPLCALSLAAVILPGCVRRQGQPYASFSIPRPMSSGDCLVIGFLGGRARWGADNRWVRKTALALRKQGGRVETVENSKKNLAMRLIREAYPETGRAKLVLYGHSFVGADTLPPLENRCSKGPPSGKSGLPSPKPFESNGLVRPNPAIWTAQRHAVPAPAAAGLFTKARKPLVLPASGDKLTLKPS